MAPIKVEIVQPLEAPLINLDTLFSRTRLKTENFIMAIKTPYKTIFSVHRLGLCH